MAWQLRYKRVMKTEGAHKTARLFAAVLMVMVMLTSCGEKETIVEVEVEVPADCPPSPPRGVYAVSLNGYVSLCWEPNLEEDVRYYDIYRSPAIDSDFEFIGYIEDEFPDNDPWEYCFEDDYPVNGIQYFYSVVAVDEGNNDSTEPFGGYLTDIVSATPRFEGLLTLYDMNVDPDHSGFDLENYYGNDPINYQNASADFYFEVSTGDGIPRVTVDSPRVMIQDYGFVDYEAYGFDAIGYSPADGWSTSGIVEMIEGHVYFIRIGTYAEANYAKLWVGEVTSGSITFWWAYQSAINNRYLSPGLPDVDGGGGKIKTLTDDAAHGRGEAKRIKRFRRGRQILSTPGSSPDVGKNLQQQKTFL